MQRHMMSGREIDASLLLHGLRIKDDAGGITRGLITHEAQHCTCILLVAVRLRHEDWLPRQLSRDVLALPLPHLMGVVVLLGQAKHAVVIDDAPAEFMPDAIHLRIDLWLIKTVVRPTSALDLASPDVHGESPDLTAAATPVLHIARTCLSEGESHGRLVVANHIQIDNLILSRWSTLLLEGVDNVEKEERVGLEGLGLFSSFPIDDADGCPALRLPCVVVIEVSLVDAIHEPFCLCVEHSVPIQRVRDLNHHNVLLRQGNGMHGRRVLGGDPADQAAPHRRTGRPRAIRHDGEDHVLWLQAHVLWADSQLNSAGHPFSCVLVHMRLCVENQRAAFHELIVEWHLAERVHAVQLELQAGRPHGHRHAPRVGDLGDMEVAILIVRRAEEVEETLPERP
mmetsp:Transcript_6593/g.15167  ORF Transcript_6593/g.15167 Transcript_6593/m.15167 type:complete len:397 (-) Transcript_6593:701-1891(-)